MTTIGYIRVSTEEQATGGISLEAQETAIRSYCQMRCLELAEIVADPGVSASKILARRKGGQRLLAALKQGHNVVAWKLDRLFRDCADCLEVTRKWDKREIALHLIDLGGQAVDTSSAMGRFFLTVMAGAAELERNQISERTKTAMALKKSKGESTGQVPYGHRLGADGRTLELEPSEQRSLQAIIRYRRAGYTLREIIDRLEREGHKPRGSKWHLTTVARLAKAA